jgi:hypothetical protein
MSDLPELPERFDCVRDNGVTEDVYTVAQMLAYAKQVREQALSDVAEQLKSAGAKLPVDNHGTIESAMNTGLSIALALVEDALKGQQ